MKVATGLAQGRSASPELAVRAVEMAMTRAGLAHPQAVLLYLSADFAQEPKAAISAAIRTAGCLQVTGCTAAGVFTEDDWVLDAPAAAAMVLGDGIDLHISREEGVPSFTLTAPNALDLHWLNSGGPRFGGVSGDATGQGPYSVWTGGRIQAEGRCQLALSGIDLHIGVSQGIRPLCPPALLDASQDHDVCSLGGYKALDSLMQALNGIPRKAERIPTHLLMAGVIYGAEHRALEEGRYHLLPVIGFNLAERSVTVAGSLTPGVSVFWALREPRAAELDMGAMLERLSARHSSPPAFALMFPCMGRGPGFHGGEDRDLKVLVQRFPRMPCIGFYGNGEIAHLDGANRLLQYSVVLGLGYEVRAHV